MLDMFILLLDNLHITTKQPPTISATHPTTQVEDPDLDPSYEESLQLS